jgi:hypothetical protein
MPPPLDREEASSGAAFKLVFLGNISWIYAAASRPTARTHRIQLFVALQATELGQFPVYMAEKTATVIFPIKPGGKQKRGPWERDDTLDFGHALSLALRRQCKKQRPVAGNRVSLAIKFGSSSCRIPVLQISEISRNSGILSKRQSESLLSRCFGSHQEICRRRQPPWTAAVHSRRTQPP